MSISIDILPTVDKSFKYLSFKQQIIYFADNEDSISLLGQEPKIQNLRNRKSLECQDIIEATNYFCFVLSRDNTLSFACEKNDDSYTDVDEYVEDYGRNLEPGSAEFVIQKFKKIGISYTLESLGGRAEGESSLFMSIVCAVSKLTDGFVVIKDNDVFSLPVGIYKLEEFHQAQPLFGMTFLTA